jgi:hypothetical protein
MTTQAYRSRGGWRKSSYSGNNGECVEIGVVELSPVGGWRKSSRSGNNGACVEIRVADRGQGPDGPVRLLAVRDSKDPDGPRLHFTPRAWADFAHRIRSGAFDNLG